MSDPTEHTDRFTDVNGVEWARDSLGRKYNRAKRFVPKSRGSRACTECQRAKKVCQPVQGSDSCLRCTQIPLKSGKAKNCEFKSAGRKANHVDDPSELSKYHPARRTVANGSARIAPELGPLKWQPIMVGPSLPGVGRMEGDVTPSTLSGPEHARSLAFGVPDWDHSQQEDPDSGPHGMGFGCFAVERTPSAASEDMLHTHSETNGAGPKANVLDQLTPALFAPLAASKLFHASSRASVACTECHRLRIRCSPASTGDPSCAPCLRSRADCVLPETSRKSSGANGPGAAIERHQRPHATQATQLPKSAAPDPSVQSHGRDLFPTPVGYSQIRTNVNEGTGGILTQPAPRSPSLLAPSNHLHWELPPPSEMLEGSDPSCVTSAPDFDYSKQSSNGPIFPLARWREGQLVTSPQLEGRYDPLGQVSQSGTSLTLDEVLPRRASESCAVSDPPCAPSDVFAAKTLPQPTSCLDWPQAGQFRESLGASQCATRRDTCIGIDCQLTAPDTFAVLAPWTTFNIFTNYAVNPWSINSLPTSGDGHNQWSLNEDPAYAGPFVYPALCTHRHTAQSPSLLQTDWSASLTADHDAVILESIDLHMDLDDLPPIRPEDEALFHQQRSL